MTPLISIHISCYNRSQMLKECLDSFLAQTWQDFEIIVVDDGSEENLAFVVGLDPRIHYYRQEHAGMARGLNLALGKSSGRYIMPFGSDDIALPELLEKTLKTLEANPSFDVVYTDYWRQNRDGGRTRSKHKEILDPEEAYKAMLESQYIPHGGTLWKAEKCPRYDETVWSAEDWELMLTAFENGVRFKHLPERLWVYRIGHSREGDTQRQVDGCIKVLARRGYYFDKETRTGKPYESHPARI